MNTNDRFLKELIRDLEQVEKKEKKEKIENKKKEREEKKKEQLKKREQKKKEQLKKREEKKKELLKSKRNRSTKGILEVGCGNIIPYQYSFKLNNTKIYVNVCLAGGQRVNELMAYLYGCNNDYGTHNRYEDINDFITTWCKFKYKLFKYDNYYVMYIYNEMYGIDFNELVLNNEVSLKDIIDNNIDSEIKDNKYADLD